MMNVLGMFAKAGANKGAVVPVNSSNPLPVTLSASDAESSGLATEAKQDTQITKLNGGLPAALGAGGGVKIDGSGTALPVSGPLTNAQLLANSEYETVAASQTDQMLGGAGAAGDYLSHLIVIPATTSPGGVSIEDGATNIPVFTGGADSVTSLTAFMIPLGLTSLSGGWEITTGADVSVLAVGNFSA